MSKIKIVTIRTAAIAVLSLLLAGRITEVHAAHRVTDMPHGMFTMEQIMQRSTPLCGALARGCRSLHITASPMNAWTSRRQKPVWLVDGVDAEDSFKVHLVWDADTGELISASRPVGSKYKYKGTLIGRKEALRITSSWLTTLGISELGSGWRPEYAPDEGAYVWRIEWWADTCGAAVTIDSHSGELIMAQTIRHTHKPEHLKIAQGFHIPGF